jgi:hypothetical protein
LPLDFIPATTPRITEFAGLALVLPPGCGSHPYSHL